MNNRSDQDQKMPRATSVNSDLKDSARDNERLNPEEIIIDLPEVKDIPGQEHIHVPPLGELADTTISSDDEEGVGILDDLNGEDHTILKPGGESDLTANDRAALENSDNTQGTRDANNFQRSVMDRTDFEGEPLNETDSGSGLDVPGSEMDDANENIGEEDEENNAYSLGGDNKDQ